MIGDGMGLQQISAAMYQSDHQLNLERFQHIGIIKTNSAKEKVTDSAAGATAFASGVKTYNGAVGLDVDGEPVPTVLEYVEDLGWATGVIATSSVTHATPACFYAHQPVRKMEEEIALDLVRAEVDFIAGGGLQFFQKRADGQDLLATFKNNGYQVSTAADETFEKVKKQFIYLGADKGMDPVLKGRGDFLPKATVAALDQLSKNRKGFFLMVEGSQIDWGGHANDLDYVTSELYDFDRTIGKVLDWAAADGETLVIVTADHETGGLTLPGTKNYEEIKYEFSTGGHTASMVPVFAFGPGAEAFQGIYENTGIYKKIRASIGGDGQLK